MSQHSTGLSDHEAPTAGGSVSARGPPAPGSYSIDEFCQRHRISRSFYYKLRGAGLGPREMHINSIVRISAQADADWTRAREEAAA